ncbi:hypothetical protein A1O1_03390 [Capronia coronata CBS 617.96]|uniref:Uncharacterized protein n=1 Tax=Capronia coronata CBS 617.96 TaxID=1182541 RepID=W9YM23_9EURO|nr:uncharacterized protein A1O1_03390 [Capronia coronata CBS 617.96]EXJ90291.1 hypothetical protein A1O1_03390 [Capronia coronata CBS 617.96]
MASPGSNPQIDQYDAAEALRDLCLGERESVQTNEERLESIEADKSAVDSTENLANDAHTADPPALQSEESSEDSSKQANARANCLIVSTTVQARRARLKTEALLELIGRYPPGENELAEFKVAEFLVNASLARATLRVDEDNALMVLDE